MTRDPMPIRDPIPSACDRAGEVYPPDPLAASDFTVLQSNVSRLALEIADEAARTLVECRCLWMPSTAPGWIYDTSRLDPEGSNVAEFKGADLDDVAKAVRYLDLRGMLVRPVAGAPQFVCFRRGV